MKKITMKQTDIPIRSLPTQQPVARIDIKNVPYNVYLEMVKECEEKGYSFKQLFLKMWDAYKK